MIARRAVAAIVLPTLLAACVHTQRPDAVTERIDSWYLKTTGYTCGATRHKLVAHSEKGSFILTQRNGGVAVPSTTYIARCGRGWVYWVEIPDDPKLKALIMRCDNGVGAFRSNCLWFVHKRGI